MLTKYFPKHILYTVSCETMTYHVFFARSDIHLFEQIATMVPSTGNRQVRPAFPAPPTAADPRIENSALLSPYDNRYFHIGPGHAVAVLLQG